MGDRLAGLAEGILEARADANESRITHGWTAQTTIEAHVTHSTLQTAARHILNNEGAS